MQAKKYGIPKDIQQPTQTKECAKCFAYRLVTSEYSQIDGKTNHDQGPSQTKDKTGRGPRGLI